MSIDEIHNFLHKNININEIKNIIPKSQSRYVALIIKCWYEKFISFYENKQNPFPGPIDNLALTDEQGKQLLSSIQYKIDYEVVEIKTWKILKNIFKGGPEFIRKFSVPATTGGSCVLTHPISLEMSYYQLTRYKTCAPDWKFADLKRFLCLNLQLIAKDYQFFPPNVNIPVNEVMTVGEYYKLHGKKVRLCKRIEERLNAIKSSCANKNANLFSTLPHSTYNDSSFRTPSTINPRSASCKF